MSFCTNCGASQNSGAVFCTACGARQNPAAAPQQSQAPSATPPVAFSAVPAAGTAYTPAPKSGNGLRNFLIIAALCLLVVVGLGIAGAIYAARVAKEKAEKVYHQVVQPERPATPAPSSSATATEPGTPGTESAAGAPPPSVPPSFPAWSGSAATGSAPPKQGMLVVTAVADTDGDYESLKQITKVDATGVTISYHAEVPQKEGQSNGPREVNVSRTVLAQDLLNGHSYNELFGPSDPASFPGSTAITASRAVLSELQQTGASAFSFRPDGAKAALGSLIGMFSSITGQDAKNIGDGSLANLQSEKCDLQKQGTSLYSFPVLLNSQPTTLPAVHAVCSTDDGPADFYILNQPDYPLMLSWKLGSGSQLQVIKITYPEVSTKAATNTIEQQLKENKKVDVYGIYFDFASDRLKPESTPVLNEIAAVLKDNPDWKLTVNGHTDNIGGDTSNLDLSKRRAAAVKQALVARYQVAPDRLITDGFGASRPVDTNATLAGRARNRRVELTRE